MPSAADALGRAAETPVQAPRTAFQNGKGHPAARGKGRHWKAPESPAERPSLPQGALDALSASARHQRQNARSWMRQCGQMHSLIGGASCWTCKSRTRPNALGAGNRCRKAFGQREMQFLTAWTASPPLHLALQKLQRNAFWVKGASASGWCVNADWRVLRNADRCSYDAL